jgi:hypothetical protein
MLLTRRILNEILRGWRIWYIPAELKKELLEEFGNPCIDDEGHLRDYTEQDICEQLRKILRPFESQYHDKDPEGARAPLPGQLSQATQTASELGLDAAKECERQQ